MNLVRLAILGFLVTWTESFLGIPRKKSVEVKCLGEAKAIMQDKVMSGQSPAEIRNLNDVDYAGNDPAMLRCLGIQIVPIPKEWLEYGKGA